MMVWSFFITAIIASYLDIVYAYDHTELFPSNDEYNLEIFNPETLYGSPYGGFARASRSRLAKLPLHLSDSTGFQFLTDENEEEEGKRHTITHPNNAPHFSIRDADGRKFVCRVYKEDELMHASAASSIFDFAIEYDEDIAKSEKQNNKAKKKPFVDIESISEKISIVQVLEDKILSQLSFDCLIHNNGWWKYKWCDEESVVQYHEDPESTIIYTLGTLKQKMMLTTATEEFATIIQEFTDGDVCVATGEKRRVHMEISCCKVGFHTQITKNNKANVHFISIQEQKTCQYSGSACSPLLCSENIEKERKLMAENITAHLEISEQASFDDASVREILNTVLDGNCVTKNAGWWTYEYCHLQQLRQFHANTFFDKKTGTAYLDIETEHSLGKYDKANDSFSDEDEKLYMLNSPLLTKSSTNNIDIDDALKKPLMGMDANDANDSNRAVFLQEYRNGDVCDHEDVTDAAIKGGSIHNGGIERATTVRFSCGPTQSLESVNEDSTCHYMIDITLPELCQHPFFKMEVGSTKVVKCLPDVNEYD